MKTKTYRINEFCDIKSGKRLPKGMSLSDEVTPYMYIRARDIKAGKISTDEVAYIDETVKKQIKKYIIEEGDIAITIVANIGDIGYCTEECSGANLTENAVRLTNIDKSIVEPRFLAYYLSQPHLKEYMEGLAIGAAQAKLGIYKIEKMKIELPSVEFQRKVIEVAQKYDELIEQNNARIRLIEKMATNFYKEWFEEFRVPGYHLTVKDKRRGPEQWELKKLDELIEFDPTIKGGMQEQYISVPMSALSTELMVLDEDKFDVSDTLSGSRFMNGDTLLARITPCLENGKTGFVSELASGEAAGGSTEYIVMRSKLLSPYLVYFIARSYYFRQTAILSMNGADGRQRAKVDKLKSIKYPLPPKAVIDAFDDFVAPIFSEIKSIQKSNKLIKEEKKLLMPRLLGGAFML